MRLSGLHTQPSTGSICWPNKRIQRRCNPLASLKQESLVAFHFQQRRLNRDALCCERWLAKLVHQRGQVNRRGLVADRAIRLAADEGQIGDVIRLAGSEAGLQYGFGKDVVELQAMLGARMIQSNGQMAAPSR